jgi:isocitrate lyase
MTGADAEQAKFEAEVKELKQWWEDPRWRYTRRPYTAESIVSKRGTIKIDYPSNQMSKKLWNLVESRFKVKPSTSGKTPTSNIPPRNALLPPPTDVSTR